MGVINCEEYAILKFVLSGIAKSKKIIVMIGVISTMLLAALDQTIVATAMPRIVQELHGLEHLSWVFTAYLLASTTIVPIAGKLSDLYGRKTFYTVSIIIFLIGSILSGLSQNMTQLIIFRGIQGIGGGAVMANSFTIIGDLFPPRERGKWQGMLGGVFGLSSVIGPLVGGWLTDNVSWRATFYVNMPVGVLALGLIFFLMPKISSNIKNKSIDYLGSIALTVGLVTLLLGFVLGGSQFTWSSSQIIFLFLTSIVSFIVFASVEQKAREPILPLSLFRNSIFSVSMLIIFLIGVAMFSTILYIPLFAQIVLGISATNSGTVLTPLMLGLISSSVITGQIVSRTGKYKLLTMLGLAIIPIALYWLSGINPQTTQGELILRTVLVGIGLGITMPVFTIVVQNAFDHSRLGVVTASTQLFRAVGGTVGVGIMGVILNNSLSGKLGELPNFARESFDVNKLQNLLSRQTGENMREILASSIGEVFFIGSLILLIAFTASFFLKEIPLRKTHEKRGILEEAGVEVAVEHGEFRPRNEPRI